MSMTAVMNPKDTMPTALAIAVPTPVPPAPSPTRLLLKRYLASPVGAIALGLLGVLVLLAVLAPWIAPQNPYDLATVSVMNSDLVPGSRSEDGTLTFLLGSDAAGRDILSAILYGLRISIVVGIASALIALMVGTAVGLVAAHFGGQVDAFLMRIVDLQLSFPTILVALTLLATLGQGVDKTLLALVIVQWAYYARNVRGSAMVERRKEYVEAAMGQGLPALRVMFVHILPNCMAPLLVTATLQTAHAITLEATMSFLGIGLPPTEPSLGLLIANGFEYLLSNKYCVSVYPGIALVLLVGAINLVGDRLRAVLNPRGEE
jgi:peptide/nickel transport system permease protein